MAVHHWQLEMTRLCVCLLVLIFLSLAATHPSAIDSDLNSLSTEQEDDDNDVGLDGPPPVVPDEEDSYSMYSSDISESGVEDDRQKRSIDVHTIIKRAKKGKKGKKGRKGKGGGSKGCQHPGDIYHGSQIHGPTSGTLDADVTLEYACDEGYGMFGNAVITCTNHAALGYYWSTQKPICILDQDYDRVLHLSNLFYEAQRSGKLPTNNRIPWRGDSALHDGELAGVDLSGGWYDAGDRVKFNLPMASATTLLGLGFLEFADAYEDAGEVGHLLDNIRWSCEYFLKTIDDDTDITKVRLYHQVGNPAEDHKYWERPEDMDESNRAVGICTCSSHCSDVAGETSSALSICSMAFNMSTPYRDVSFSKRCLDVAFRMWEFGRHPDCRGVYRDKGFYRSQSYWDELVQATLLLYSATSRIDLLDAAHEGFGQLLNSEDNLIDVKESETYVPVYSAEDNANTYINEAKIEFNGNKGAIQAVATALSWGDKRPIVHLLLFKFLREKEDATSKEIATLKKVQSKVSAYLDKWMNEVNRVPGGLRVRTMLNGDWGSHRYAANTAFVALMAAHYDMKMSTHPKVYSQFAWRRFAVEQIHYMLGDHGQCYVVGYGPNCCKHPHHRGSSCPESGKCGFKFLNNGENSNVLEGALCGGPDKDGRYEDDIKDYFHNEVTCDYNAGFQSAVAGLKFLQLLGIL